MSGSLHSLSEKIKAEAKRLGFSLAGITTPDPPAHYDAFEHWLKNGHHAQMTYLATERSRLRRADPRQIMPECQSVLVLGLPYPPPNTGEQAEHPAPHGKIAAYAQGTDYHDVIPALLAQIVQFIETEVGHRVHHLGYTDTGPILERELAQRAGLGWVGKNSCLINPKQGSYFFLAELFLDLSLPPDPAYTSDHCGTCTRCIDACPTGCILPNRTLDARLCISYLTIENKQEIPDELQSAVGNWVFGCDICQMVCPWNRFAPSAGHPALAQHSISALLPLPAELQRSPQEFNQTYKGTPIKRAKRKGLFRNMLAALGNTEATLPIQILMELAKDPEPLIRQQAQRTIEKISKRQQQS